MTTCESIRAQMTFYLDDELRDGEASALEKHLSECVACLEGFDSEHRFLESVRACNPLHIAPSGLRARVEEELTDAPSTQIVPAEFRNRIQRLVGPFRYSRSSLLTYPNV